MANILETFAGLPMKSKAIIVASVITAITGAVLLFAWSQRLQYRILYAGLAESDAGAVVQKLGELKVPYKVEGSSIMVPEDKVYDIRLQLAAMGLPHGGGVGFELFDKTDFGATDFVQKLNYRRALQGEMARTIMSLSEVEQCRVHLAVPERSVFSEQASKPSASVLVKLRQGRTLSQSQVQGIVHLVSNSVEGLNPGDVTVVDSKGEMLTRPADALGGLSNSQLEYQRNYEKEIESRVLGILEPVVGKGRARARATASFDFSRNEKTEEKFDPEGQVVRSEQRSQEKSSSGVSGGVPGVSSNLPGKAPAQSAATQGQSQKQNETINYEVTKTTSRTVNSPGDLRKLSIAVIVDGVYAQQKGAKEKQYAPRSEEDIKRYEDLVKKAVGFTQERGDEVRVVNMQFESAAEEPAGEAPSRVMPIVLSVLRYLVPVAAVILFFLIVVRPMVKVLSSQPAPRPAELPLPQTVSELERAMGKELAAPGSSMIQADVIEWARKNPDKAAGLIKNWLGEK